MLKKEWDLWFMQTKLCSINRVEGIKCGYISHYGEPFLCTPRLFGMSCWENNRWYLLMGILHHIGVIFSLELLWKCI